MIHILTDMQIRKATHPETKSLSDGKGLSIEITPNQKGLVSDHKCNFIYPTKPITLRRGKKAMLKYKTLSQH